MATSTVPAVKAALLTALTTALGSVQVKYAHPGDTIAKECVFMADAEFDSEDSSIGQVSHYETYTVPVWVDVLSEGNDVQAAEARMWVLVGLVEAAVRSNGTLSATPGLLSATVTGPNAKAPQNYITDQAWASRCRIAVQCKAKI